ncbi:MAG: type II toxin-antitoxin system VapC family toxin [Candidatus Bathyarchaeia archaeon]
MDASVVAKWVLPGEPYQEKAVKLKEDHVSGAVDLCAPAFLVLEVANSLWTAVKLKRLSKEDAQEALRALNDMKIDFQELDWGQASQGLEIAYKLDLAIYDACYVFLTSKMKAQLITADNKFYEKAKGNFNVLHVKDYL